MKENLSERLCKECGIEPKYWCSYHSCICPIQDIGKFNPKCPKQAVTKECDARSKEPRYPDFENNNNNFIKLMELDFDKNKNLKNKFKSLWGFINYISDHSLINKKHYLKELIDFLNCSYKKYIEQEINDIKQAIIETNWEY